MTLRCRKGDMAIVLSGSVYGNEGRFCSVDGFIGRMRSNGQIYENVWDISFSGETHNLLNGVKWAAPDHCLLPIRPGDLDETEETEKFMEFTHAI